MTTGTTQKGKPRGLLRLFLRAPIWLYRLRLGWILGDRFVMFRHTGRKSGLYRYTVVEVVRRDSPTNTYIVASGWGEKSDWLKNIQKSPEVFLYTKRGQFPARAIRLPVEDSARELADYARRHPAAFRGLSKMMVGQPLGSSEEDCRLLAQSVPVVSFIPEK